MFKNIGWTLGNSCPCNCKHCYSMQVRQQGKSLTKEIVDRVIEQILTVGAETINLGGNEPLFTNGLDAKKSLLPYIIDKAIENNLDIGITSAGPSIIGLYQLYPEYLSKINDIDISIDSPIPEEHNKNRGADVFKLAIKSLEICNEYNIPHTIVMCAMKWNFTIDRIKELIKISKKYNANIRINMLKPTELKHLDMMPTKDQVEKGYRYLMENCYSINLSDPALSATFTHDNNSIGCCCGINSLRINSISPEGSISVSPCVYMHHHKIGNLITDNLLDIVKSKQFQEFVLRKEKYDLIEECKNCNKLDICRGGCAAAAYWFHYYKNSEKSMFKKDPYCMYSNKIKEKETDFVQSQNLVHENYLCTWIGKAK